MWIDIEEQYDKIYRFCYFKLHNADIAEDITQETFLRFLEYKTYRDMGKPIALLYTMARNLCMDEFRRQEKEAIFKQMGEKDERIITNQHISTDIGTNIFEDQLINQIALQEAMQTLSQEEQELVLLRYVNEVPIRELCEMYEISRFALYRELKKITKKLERSMSDETKVETRVKKVLSSSST